MKNVVSASNNGLTTDLGLMKKRSSCQKIHKNSFFLFVHWVLLF